MTRAQLISLLSPNDTSTNDHHDIADDIVTVLTDAQCELIIIALTQSNDTRTLTA